MSEPDGTKPPHQVVLFEEPDAQSVARALITNGFSAQVEQLPFAGEDDDEDHPWSVWSDAPHVMLELAADEFDGWVVYDDVATVAPITLPTQPKRHHRPPDQPLG